MLICTDCELHYEVIWNNDGMETPDRYCPRCGSNELVDTNSEEQAAIREKLRNQQNDEM